MIRDLPSENKLKAALELYQQEWVLDFPSDSELKQCKFSLSFDKKMKKLIRLQRMPYYSLINTVGKRIAIFAFVLLLTLTTTVFSVEALRTPVVNFFVEVYEKFSHIVFLDDASPNSKLDIIEDYLMPQYIPKGFELQKEEVYNNLASYEYRDINGRIITYEQSIFNENNVMIDTENTITEDILINGTNGVFYSNKGYDNLIFLWEDYIFIFSAPSEIGKEELVQIAESLNKNNG